MFWQAANILGQRNWRAEVKLIEGSDLLKGIDMLRGIEDFAEMAEQPASIKIVMSGLQMRRHTIWVYRPSLRDKIKKSALVLRLIWRGDKDAQTVSGDA
jgi:hypothetical protein